MALTVASMGLGSRLGTANWRSSSPTAAALMPKRINNHRRGYAIVKTKVKVAKPKARSAFRGSGVVGRNSAGTTVTTITATSSNQAASLSGPNDFPDCGWFAEPVSLRLIPAFIGAN